MLWHFDVINKTALTLLHYLHHFDSDDNLAYQGMAQTQKNTRDQKKLCFLAPESQTVFTFQVQIFSQKMIQQKHSERMHARPRAVTEEAGTQKVEFFWQRFFKAQNSSKNAAAACDLEKQSRIKFWGEKKSAIFTSIFIT